MNYEHHNDNVILLLQQSKPCNSVGPGSPCDKYFSGFGFLLSQHCCGLAGHVMLLLWSANHWDPVVVGKSNIPSKNM